MRPPQFASNVVFKHRFRFGATGTSNTVSVKRSDLLGLLFSNRSGSTSNSRIVAAAKLNRVEAWGTGGDSDSVSAVTIISLEWRSANAPTLELSDTGSPYRPPHLITSPPSHSLAGFWSLTGTNESEELFIMRVIAGTTVDIWVDMVLFDGETPVAVTTTASGTVGQLYAGFLDASSTKLLQPVSLGSLS